MKRRRSGRSVRERFTFLTPPIGLLNWSGRKVGGVWLGLHGDSLTNLSEPSPVNDVGRVSECMVL